MEETGFPAAGVFIPLKEQKQPSGKIVSAWAFEGDCDAKAIKSNTFLMEWPSHSGQQKEFPEVDRAEWFTTSIAKEKILKGQRAFIVELEEKISNQKMTGRNPKNCHCTTEVNKPKQLSSFDLPQK